MQRLTLLLRRSKKKRCLPADIATVPAAPLRYGWGNINRMSAAERRAVVNASWTETTENPNLSNNHNNTINTNNNKTIGLEEVNTHHSHNDIMNNNHNNDMEDEDDEDLNNNIPAGQIAREFFADLAREADNDMDMNIDLCHNSTELFSTQSDADRSDEARDVHRHFFADFYTQQQLIPSPNNTNNNNDSNTNNSNSNNHNDINSNSNNNDINSNNNDMLFRFVDSMLRPPALALLVNTAMPFVRMMLHAQLTTHCQYTYNPYLNNPYTHNEYLNNPYIHNPYINNEYIDNQQGDGVVFCPHPQHPLLYTVEVVPTQRIGDPLRLPYTRERSVLAQREMQETHIIESGENNASNTSSCLLTTIKEKENDLMEIEMNAELLGSMMSDSNDDNNNNNGIVQSSDLTHTRKEEDDECKRNTPHRREEEIILTSNVQSPQVITTPLSVGHLYWLQRQIAADTLIDVDPLGLMIPLILSIHRSNNNNNNNNNKNSRILLDMSTRAYGVQEYAYTKDIAAHFTTSQLSLNDIIINNDDDMNSVEYKEKANTIIISLLPPPTTQQEQEHEKEGKRKNKRESHRGMSHSVKAAVDEIPADDSAYLYQQQQQLNEQFHYYYYTGVEGCITVQGPPRRICRLLRGACDAVLCCPRTTADGRKPRAALGTSGSETQTTTTGRLEEEEEAAANRFISICSKVNKTFSYLRRELAQAIRYTSPHGGCIVYATHSMNPLENEAVVCSVLTDVRRQHPEWECRPVSLLDPHKQETKKEKEETREKEEKEKEEINDSAMELLRSLMTGGRAGVATWIPLEDAPAEQEVSYNAEDIMTAVANCAWRADPLHTKFDVCFICVLKLWERPSTQLLSSSSSSSQTLLTSSSSSLSSLSLGVVKDNSSVVSAFPWLDTDHLKNRWDLIISWNDKKRVFVVASTAVLRWMKSLRPTHHRNDYNISGYGIRVDTGRTSSYSPTQQQKQQQIEKEKEEKEGQKLEGKLLSCTLSGTLLAFAFADSVRMDYVPFRIFKLPIVAILELLHKKQITWQRLGELLSTKPAVLKSIETSASQLKGNVHTVFIKAAIPEILESESNRMELDADVMDELEKLVIVAHLRSNYRSSSHAIVCTLRLDGTSARERCVLAERVVAISDALRYLLRRLDYPAEMWGSDNRSANEIHHDNTINNNNNNNNNDTNGYSDIQLQDDEYEVEMHASSSFSAPNNNNNNNSFGSDYNDNDEYSFLGKHTRRMHEQKMQKLRKKLGSFGVSADGSPLNDWDNDVKHMRRKKRAPFAHSPTNRI